MGIAREGRRQIRFAYRLRNFGYWYAQVFGEQPIDAVLLFPANPSYDLIGLNRGRDVVDEVDQHAYADHGQQQAHADEKMGHEDTLVGTPNGSQHEQAVDKRCH